MPRKLALVLLACSLIYLGNSVYAGSGIFGSGVELNINGSLTLYALDKSGGTSLEPTGSSATLDQTSWSNSSTEPSPTFNLGTFNPAAGQTLTLTGGSLLTFKNGSSDVTGAFLDFRIFQGSPGGAFTEFGLPFNANLATSGDQRWASESQTFNLLSGLQNGTYTLGVFLRETSTDGGAFSSDGGVNYGATFTVVPEPASYAMFGIPAVFGAWLMRRRRPVA